MCNCVSVGQLHLSFSLSTGGEDGNKKERETEVIPVQSLNLLLKSIGATLTDAQDVLFKYLHSLSLRQEILVVPHSGLPSQTLTSHMGFSGFHMWLDGVN